MTSVKKDYPVRKDRKFPPHRSGRWLFGMLLVISFFVFAILVFMGTSIST